MLIYRFYQFFDTDAKNKNLFRGSLNRWLMNHEATIKEDKVFTYLLLVENDLHAITLLEHLFNITDWLKWEKYPLDEKEAFRTARNISVAHIQRP